MKNFISKQKNCFWTLLSLIILCEILLKVNNKFIQCIGIILTPVIIIFSILLMKNDYKKEEN